MLLHILTFYSLSTRVKSLFNAIKQNHKDQVKVDILFIILIIGLWAFLFYGLPRLFNI